tara:strand:- start:564 stop:1811 length:1248 start_codon:yes stop_codon:yes gene_type:complete
MHHDVLEMLLLRDAEPSSLEEARSNVLLEEVFSSISAEEIIAVIDDRAPEEVFVITDIFTDGELRELRANPNLNDLKDLSEIIYQSIIEGGSDEDETDSEDETDETLDESGYSHEKERQKYERYFGTYKRMSDISSKIRKDDNYDIDALVKRRTKPIPASVPFGMTDIFSVKEIEAIMKHPTYRSLGRTLRSAFDDAISSLAEEVAEEIDQILIDAFLSDTKVLRKCLATEAIYRAGMATHIDGEFRLSELGAQQGRDLVRAQMIVEPSQDFVLEDATFEEVAGVENTPKMSDAIRQLAQSKTRISIRPNLNSKGEVTIHTGSLGRKLASVKAVTIKCEGVVVRPSGTKKAVAGDKTVHAGFIGRVMPFVIMPKSGDPAVTYNPHKGDKEFKVNGKTYEGGGVVTMVGWKAFKVK